MGLVHVRREWLAPGGWDGDGWSRAQVTRFEKLMRANARTLVHGRWVKPVKGEPALVDSWDDGRMVLCWYTARACPDERALLAKCVEIFGCAPTHIP